MCICPFEELRLTQRFVLILLNCKYKDRKFQNHSGINFVWKVIWQELVQFYFLNIFNINETWPEKSIKRASPGIEPVEEATDNYTFCKFSHQRI